MARTSAGVRTNSPARTGTAKCGMRCAIDGRIHARQHLDDVRARARQGGQARCRDGCAGTGAGVRWQRPPLMADDRDQPTVGGDDRVDLRPRQPGHADRIVPDARHEVEVNGHELARGVDAAHDGRQLEPVAAEDEQDRRPAVDGCIEMTIGDDGGAARRPGQARHELGGRWCPVGPGRSSAVGGDSCVGHHGSIRIVRTAACLTPRVRGPRRDLPRRPPRSWSGHRRRRPRRPVTSISDPFVTPSVSTPRMLFASAGAPSRVTLRTVIFEPNRPAVFTNRAAGRAWSPDGFRTTRRTELID